MVLHDAVHASSDSKRLAALHFMKLPRPQLLIAAVGIGVALVAVASFVEAPARRLAPDERIPERILLRKHPKIGGDEIASLTNREDILSVMTALPSSYTGTYCACFGFFNLEFYAPTGVYRTINYKPGFTDSHLTDSAHPTGQSFVPRRFKRFVGRLIDEHNKQTR